LERLDRLECLTGGCATPVLAQLILVQLGPGEYNRSCSRGKLLSITSSESIRTLALPSAWRAWK
jgi:hypothetical protein